MKEEKKNNSKSFVCIIVVICLVFACVLGISIFMFLKQEPKEINKKYDGGEIELTYADDSNIFSITKATPTTDAVGIKMDKEDQYFDFTVESTFDSALEIDYEIYVEKVGDTSTINDEDIRIYLEKQNSGTYESVFEPKEFKGLKKKSALGTPKDAMVLYSGNTTVDVSENYRLRMWMSDKAANSSTSNDYAVEVHVIGKAK